MSRIPALACLLIVLPLDSGAAAPPEPIDATLFAFPGATANPASAASAGVALADRWLGDRPFDNPAIARARGLEVSGLLLRVSRQDLRADNRQYDEQAAYLDGAGAYVALPAGPLALALYASQPSLRREQNAFQRGEQGGPTAPAVVQTSSELREARAGASVSAGSRQWRFGAGAEWTNHDESYQYIEQSGSPDAGQRDVSFSGTGFGYQAGARWQSEVPDGAAVGVGFRFLPQIDLDGDQTFATLVRDTTIPVSARLESATELGASARFGVAPGFQVLLGGGMRTARGWEGFGVESGETTSWTVGGLYHDPETPWTVRFGVGQEHQDSVPEPRAGTIGLGIGWRWDTSVLDFGLVHRSLERRDQPTSADDRIVVSYQTSF